MKKVREFVLEIENNTRPRTSVELLKTAGYPVAAVKIENFMQILEWCKENMNMMDFVFTDGYVGFTDAEMAIVFKLHCGDLCC